MEVAGGYTVPLEVIESWPTPNYTNPVLRGPGFWISLGLTLGSSVIVVGVRLYGRVFVRRWVGPDDILICVSLICFIGISIVVALGNGYWGWNRHIWDLKLDDVAPSRKVLYVARLLFTVASLSVRLSVICLYYRLMRSFNSRGALWTLHLATLISILLASIQFGLMVFTCSPIRAYWQYFPTENHKCIDDALNIQIGTISNTAIEFVVAILPVLAVFHLGVVKEQRWSVVGLFSLGFLTTIAGIFRTYYLYQITDTWDISWYGWAHWLAAQWEICAALLSACAPPLRPIIGRAIRRVRGLPLQRPTYLEKKNQESESSQSSGPTSSQFSTTGATPRTRKFDATESWNRSILRTVDLEGIRDDDGLGYTVRITGPARTVPKRKWPGHIIRTSLDLPNGSDLLSTFKRPSLIVLTEQTEPPPSSDLKIEARKSFEIRESYRVPPSQSYAGGSVLGQIESRKSWDSNPDVSTQEISECGTLHAKTPENREAFQRGSINSLDHSRSGPEK